MLNKIDAKTLRDMILSGSNNLQNHKDLVDKLNVFPVPDGDTGTNMSLTIASAIKELNNNKEDDITVVGKAISKGSLMGARGNSGVILSQIIRGFARGIEGKTELTVVDLANALKLGSDTAYKAVIKPVEGTILTVIRESSEYALEIVKKEKDIISFFELVINKANESLNRTPELLLALKEAGVVDSGGKGLVIFYEGMLSSLKGDFISPKDGLSSNEVQVKSMEYVSSADIEFGYCTEFILETDKITTDEIRDLMLPLGDSLAVVGDEGIIKVHVHTNEPGNALQIALSYGQLVTVKIENMRLQHENLIIEDKIEEVEEKEYAIIATSMGDGIAGVFKDLGVDYIIEGGQTMNPSTEDFMKAISSVNARNIVILPNNSNIIMAANQAKDLSDKNIVVIPTKTVPQGVATLLNFDMELSLEENKSNMTESISLVKTGQITYAVRDTVINDVEVKKGNYIGIADGTLSTSNIDIVEAILKTVETLYDEDVSLITLYYGEDITEEDAQLVVDELELVYEDLDVELIYGGQPVYYYLIGIE